MKIRYLLVSQLAMAILSASAVDTYRLHVKERFDTYADITEYAFINPEKWSMTNGDATKTTNKVFDAAADYIFRNAYTRLIVRFTENRTFEGGRLIAGEGEKLGALLIYSKETNPNLTTFGNNGLKIVHGSILCASTGARTNLIDGKIEVDTHKKGHAYIMFNNEGDVLRHQGTLSIVEGKNLEVGKKEDDIGGGRRFGTFELTAENSCSAVNGILSVHSYSNIVHGVKYYDKCDTTLALASTELPGTLDIGINCRLKMLNGGDVLNVDTLKLADNSWLDFSYDSIGDQMAKIEVFSPLQPGGVVNVMIPDAVSGNSSKYPLLSFPSNSDISIRNFKLFRDGIVCRWLTMETVDDKKVLFANYPKVVKQNIAKAYLGKAESWTDGSTAVEAGKNYALEAGVYEVGTIAAPALWMPESGEDYVFKGNSLTIGGGGRFLWNFRTNAENSPAQQFTCSMLRVLSGGYLEGQKDASLKINGGKVDLVSGVIYAGVANNRCLTFDSEIIGAAEAVFEGITRNGTSSGPHGRYVLNALNTNFYGCITVKQKRFADESGKPYIGFNTSCSLTITNALSLGGNLLDHDPKALLLARYATLIVGGNTTLATASNRGIFIEDIGRIRVGADKQDNPYTFRMETPLAINGTFYKEGLGTLELAGDMAFGADGLSEIPTEGSNGFVVTGGIVRVCSAGAIDGCSMLLYEGASFELAVDFENEELMAQGIRNVKTDNPFVLEGVEKLPLSLKFAEGVTPPSTKFTVPLLTVSSRAAASVRAMLPSVKTPFKSYQATLKEIVDSETGNVTFAYELQYQAMKVIVR